MSLLNRSGGLDILFGHQKELQVEVPDSNGQVGTAAVYPTHAACVGTNVLAS